MNEQRSTPAPVATDTQGGSQSAPRHRWVGWLTILLYLVTGLFPYLVSGLAVPGVGLIVLMTCWAIGLTFTIRLARSRPVVSLLAIPTAWLFWWAYVSAGEAIFGWTA